MSTINPLGILQQQEDRSGIAHAPRVNGQPARAQSTGQTTLPWAATASSGTGPADATATPSSDTGAATITSSDFLTLLVAELKNQDPTSDQDPNAYINQLVGVNSLQQLISINQDLTPTTSSGSPTGSSSPSSSMPAGTGVPSAWEPGSASGVEINAMLAARPLAAGAGASPNASDGTSNYASAVAHALTKSAADTYVSAPVEFSRTRRAP